MTRKLLTNVVAQKLLRCEGSLRLKGDGKKTQKGS